MADSLGVFTFRHWIGPPPGVIRQTVQTLEHPGVDYEAYRWIGQRSGTFTRRSKSDFNTLSNARVTYRAYALMITTSPHQLIWDDYDFDTENVRAVVEDVSQVYLAQHLLIAGAQADGNTWDMECEWRFRLAPV